MKRVERHFFCVAKAPDLRVALLTGSLNLEGIFQIVCYWEEQLVVNTFSELVDEGQRRLLRLDVL